MTVRRIVADLSVTALTQTRDFYVGVLGLEVVMDQGWIVTLADPADPRVQVSLMTHDATAPVMPSVSVELGSVEEVDAAYASCLARSDEIVHPITDEPWGVHRFFVRDPSGVVVNVLSHG